MMIALSLATLLAVAQPEQSPLDQAAAVIDRLHEAASKADAAVYFDLYTPDARFIGTDAGERWSVDQLREYAGPAFSSGRGWTYHPKQRHIVLLDDPCQCVAVFDELLDNEKFGEVRGSGVVVKRGDAWKIHQYVLSFAVPNDIAYDVADTIKAATQSPVDQGLED